MKKFILNENPYRSAFPFVSANGIRGKDQVSIVIALNVYGADHPGFAVRLNHVLKEIANSPIRQAQNVTVLMAAQMEFQQQEISLINFVDRELIELVNKNTKNHKGKKIALWCLIGCAASMGAPGFTMLGFPVLGLPCGLLCAYCFLFKVVYWACIPVFKDDVISASVRSAGECVSPQQIQEQKQAIEAPVCKQCGAALDAADKFCSKCGAPR